MVKLPQIDTWKVEKLLATFVQDYLKKSGRKRVVLGLSGGLDSATAAFLAQEALGSKNVIALILPFRTSSKQDADDALDLCRILNIKCKVLDISPMVDAYLQQFPPASCQRRGNKMARERMSILYDWAAYHQALVLGTSNRTELLLGYFTKYGDGAADLEPLGNLYKTEVKQLAHSLGIPAKIIGKTPSAGLWKGQTDEKELGFSYALLDSLLYHLVDKKYNLSELVEAGFDRNQIQIIRERIENNKHKRNLPPIPVIPANWRR